MISLLVCYSIFLYIRHENDIKTHKFISIIEQNLLVQNDDRLSMLQLCLVVA
jgi:hypothetical protein